MSRLGPDYQLSATGLYCRHQLYSLPLKGEKRSAVAARVAVQPDMIMAPGRDRLAK